jgi:hypothetical protein
MSQRKSKLRRPSRIKILNMTYKIKFVDETERVAAEADGWCDSTTQTIAVFKLLPNEAMADTFLHECIHAVGNVMGVDWSKEEQVAHRIATGMCTVVKTNPNVFKWWQSLL